MGIAICEKLEYLIEKQRDGFVGPSSFTSALENEEVPQ